jgi:hypothetical protein
MQNPNFNLVYFNKEELKQVVMEVFSEVITQVEKKQPSEEPLGGMISQKEAMKLLNRKTTWFHYKRVSGELPAIKSGNQWWYNIEDIQQFIKSGTISNTSFQKRIRKQPVNVKE